MFFKKRRGLPIKFFNIIQQALGVYFLIAIEIKITRTFAQL